MTKIPTWQERCKQKEPYTYKHPATLMQAEIADLRAALTKARRMARKPDCKWACHMDEEIMWWATACGERSAEHPADVPVDVMKLGLKFCPGCGGKVKL